MNDPRDEQGVLPLDVAFGILMTFFKAVVEAGELEISDRSPGQIVEEFKSIIAEDFDDTDPRGWITAIDHREYLLDQAAREARSGRSELAATLYAIWVEHFVNGMLTRAFERTGYKEEVIIPLIKELRLATKATALWQVAGLPALGEDSLKLMGRIVEYRNSFVHYKWSARAEQVVDERKEQVRAIVEQADQLVSALQAAESSAFWNGRYDELIGNLREDFLRRWAEEPFGLT